MIWWYDDMMVWWYDNDMMMKWCDEMVMLLWSIWWSIWWQIRIHDDDMVMSGYPINHRLLPVIALSLGPKDLANRRPWIYPIEQYDIRCLMYEKLTSWATAPRKSQLQMGRRGSARSVQPPMLLQTTENPVHCQVHLFLRKIKWWSADAVRQRGDRTEVCRTDTSDCASMTIHEGWTNLQGLALPMSDEFFRRCSRQDISPIWLQIRAQIPIYCSSSTRMRIISWTEPVGASSFSRHWLPLWSANFGSQISHPKGEEVLNSRQIGTFDYENLTLMRRTSKPAGSSRIKRDQTLITVAQQVTNVSFKVSVA